MAAYMENAPVFVDTLYALAYLPAQQREFFGVAHLGHFACAEI